MDKEKILKIIDVWLGVEETLIAGSEEGTWARERHCGSIEYLHQFKELLEIKDTSFEEKALKSFEALTSSRECRQFMEDYYGHD